MAAVGVIAGVAAIVSRQKNQQAKASATRQASNANLDYIKQKQDARNNNQAPDEEALNRARQQSVLNLQQRSGRASTFLSNGLGG